MGHRQRGGKNVACVLHLTEVEILALLQGPGCHLLSLVLTDAVAHLPCAKISIFYCDCCG